jgi:dihydroflavonol-4-reductase
VRTTVRDLAREAQVRSQLRNGCAGAAEKLRVVRADLQSDDGWSEAVAGCDAVLHVAPPTLTQVPKNDDQMVRPATGGTLRVLRAARDADVRRVVMTSAIGAIAYGHTPRDTPFTEQDWTNVDAGIAPYQKSKTLAERAAWDFVAGEGRGRRDRPDRQPSGGAQVRVAVSVRRGSAGRPASRSRCAIARRRRCREDRPDRSRGPGRRC